MQEVVSSPAIGSRVELCNLVKRTELNGRVGTVMSYDEQKGRAVVKLGSKQLLLKADNMKKTDDSADAATSFECCVCWMDVPGKPAELPCCGAPPPGASTCYCKRCLEVICETALGGMGRCPTCREFIQIVDGEVLVAEGLQTCCVCSQARPVAERRGAQALCAACAIGVRHPLRYECERCHRIGPVPHPLYRYQPTPGDFGNNPWFCQACADFTNRRVVPQDLVKVPPDDCPESWGRQEEWLAQIRAHRQREVAARRGAADGATDANAAAGTEDTAAVAAGACPTRMFLLGGVAVLLCAWLWS
jgi:hypothetical protein